jgi:hypothetical protein
MDTSSTSRDQLPQHLLNAKQQAAARYLTSGPPRGFVAFGATAEPETNVVGVGLGPKLTDGSAPGQPAVRFYVERKLPKEVIPASMMLPEEINGVPTDVVETGRFRKLPAAAPIPLQRRRPAQPGSSVGFQFPPPKTGWVMAGTFGAVVQDSAGRYILSNNHVLADENALAAGSPIFQPGLLDGGNPATDQVAALARFVSLQNPAANNVDCAIATVLNPAANPALVRATFLPSVGKLASNQPIAAAEGMQVHKVGRTTGYTRGVVFDVSADVQVEYDLGVLVFTNQILIRGTAGRFSDQGDSGSVIVDRATKRATALLFAGSSSHTIANHLSDALAALGVALVI